MRDVLPTPTQLTGHTSRSKGELVRMSTNTKMEVAVYPVPVPESSERRGELYPWCHVRVDIRNLSLTVDHHFEYQ